MLLGLGLVFEVGGHDLQPVADGHILWRGGAQLGDAARTAGHDLIAGRGRVDGQGPGGHGLGQLGAGELGQTAETAAGGFLLAEDEALAHENGHAKRVGRHLAAQAHFDTGLVGRVHHVLDAAHDRRVQGLVHVFWMNWVCLNMIE